MLLSEGVNPYTNQTVVPRSVFTEMTTSHSISVGAPTSPFTGIVGYGMGWMRTAFQGHDVRELVSFAFDGVRAVDR